MAISSGNNVASTFSNFGGAVEELFAGLGAEKAADMKAQGLRINAQGQLITAQGTVISAESTNISATGLRIKAAGDLAEAAQYDLAATLARKNEEYTAQSTAIQQMQLDRQISATIGGQQAGTGAAGLKASGSALDLMADSAAQGALAKDVLARQGLISEAGYEEQAQSYGVMSAAARAAYVGEMDVAARTDVVATEQRNIASAQTMIAGETNILADQTAAAGKQQAMGSYIGAAMKGVAAVASIFGVPSAPAAPAAEGPATGSPAGLPEQA